MLWVKHLCICFNILGYLWLLCYILTNATYIREITLFFTFTNISLGSWNKLLRFLNGYRIKIPKSISWILFFYVECMGITYLLSRCVIIPSYCILSSMSPIILSWQCIHWSPLPPSHPHRRLVKSKLVPKETFSWKADHNINKELPCAVQVLLLCRCLADMNVAREVLSWSEN